MPYIMILKLKKTFELNAQEIEGHVYFLHNIVSIVRGHRRWCVPSVGLGYAKREEVKVAHEGRGESSFETGG